MQEPKLLPDIEIKLFNCGKNATYIIWFVKFKKKGEEEISKYIYLTYQYGY